MGCQAWLPRYYRYYRFARDILFNARTRDFSPPIA
jgi:hypothetical protein